MLSFVNRRHMSLEKLETAQRELIELYLRLDCQSTGVMARRSQSMVPSTIFTTTICLSAITSAIGRWAP
ncbi:MAG: Mobile element protein [uncultured Paraburkholderia sp.]|nr:MAG: Mobile element protein [uncultured Paraburkholderia sp.]